MDIRHLAAVLLFSLQAFAHATADAPGDILFRDGAESGFHCTLATPGEVTMNLRSARVQPMFRLDGRNFPAQSAHSASFHLIPRDGEPIPLGFSSEASPAAVRVLAGVYDVEYRWVAGSLVPRNHAARVLHGVLLDRDQTLEINVPSQTLSGDLTLNGAGFPAAGATLSLKSLHRLGQVPLGSSPISSYSVRLIPGVYQLHYLSQPRAWASMPANLNAHWGRFEIEPRRSTLDLDLPMVNPLFHFRFDGVQAFGLAAESGRISLRTANGDQVGLGETHEQTAQRRLIPGTYDVHYEWISGSAIAPANTDRRVYSRRSIGDGQHVIDIPTVVVQGELQFNGVRAPDVNSESGRVDLHDRVTGSATPLGWTRYGRYELRIIPGHYDLGYVSIAGTAIAPRNANALFEAGRPMLVEASGPINLVSDWIDTRLTVNGQSFPAFAVESVMLWIRSDKDREPVLVGATNWAGGNGGVRLLRAEYMPIIASVSGAALAPVNTFARLPGRFHSPSPSPGVQTLDLRTAEFQFRFTHNGAPLPGGTSHVARFELRHQQDSVDLGDSLAPSWPRRILTNAETGSDHRGGTLYYSRISGIGPNLPQNTDSPAGCVIFGGDN
ncbi:MAG: hypothetical protein MEQ07_10375 [Aquimonas sp.]|nr:hypothetical protein [Aquimonas sp.]